MLAPICWTSLCSENQKPVPGELLFLPHAHAELPQPPLCPAGGKQQLEVEHLHPDFDHRDNSPRDELAVDDCQRSSTSHIAENGVSRVEEANVYSAGGCFSSVISGGLVIPFSYSLRTFRCRCPLWKRSAGAYSFLRNAPVCSTTRNRLLSCGHNLPIAAITRLLYRRWSHHDPDHQTEP